MTKKVYRYFFGFFKEQEKWLNKMAARGYRLIRTTKLMYEFELCANEEYDYCVEFVADKSSKKLNEYRQFLEDLGYRSFTKNINLNYSIGKVKWRPYAKGFGQLATSPGNYNKELLILEKKRDGKPFELHTDTQDMISYYTTIRSAYLCNLFLFVAFLIVSFIPNIDLGSISIEVSRTILSIIVLVFLIPIVLYSKILHQFKQKKKIYE